jgi:hypothetical protein
MSRKFGRAYLPPPAGPDARVAADKRAAADATRAENERKAAALAEQQKADKLNAERTRQYLGVGGHFNG